MALNKITYEDKVAINPQPSVADKNKVSDADMNEIKAVVNQVVEDTGWVDMSSYVNTANFAVRPGYTPMVRKIGNVVYWRGAVYCHTSPNSTQADILTGIPSTYLPYLEQDGCGVHFSSNTIYKIFISGIGAITVNEGATNIFTTQDWQGFSLSDLGTYLTD
jgi:hypothetical protein